MLPDLEADDEDELERVRADTLTGQPKPQSPANIQGPVRQLQLDLVHERCGMLRYYLLIF